MAALLNQLEGAQADVDDITQLVYKYTQCIEDRLPVLALAKSSGHEAMGLDMLSADNVNLQLVDQDRWRHIGRDAAHHLSSLMQAHNLLVAVADVCQEAAAALIAIHTASEPLLLSTGREVLHAFMHLFCSTARMALLLNEMPRRHIASLMQACHHLMCEQASSRAGSAGGGATGQDLHGCIQPLPDMDLPIYKAQSMVAFMQQLYQPLAPRVQQVMELSVAPALLALFPAPGPQPPGTPNKIPTATTATTCQSQLPNIFHIPDPAHQSTPDTTAAPDQHTPIAITAERGDKHVLLGPGGMQMQVAHAACLRYDLLQQWVLLGYLCCPASLHHPGSISLLTHALSREIVMQLHEERCCWIGLLHIQSLGALDCLPALPGSQLSVSNKESKKQRIQMMVEARAAVQQAVSAALMEGPAWQSLLRLECLQQLQQATAMCQAHPRLLAAHMPKLLGLLGLSRHAVLWQCRHLGFASRLPHGLTKLAPGLYVGSAGGAGGSAGGGGRQGSHASAGGASMGGGSDVKLGRNDRASGATAHASTYATILRPPANISTGAKLSLPGIAQALLGVPGGGAGEGWDMGLSGGGSQLPETDRAALLSMLQLMKAMEDLVDLMEVHMKPIRERLKHRAAQLLQRHIIPGHVRLSASKLTSANLAVTVYDVELMLTQIRGLLQQPDPPADPIPAAAIKLVWRLLQQHTLMMLTPASSADDETDVTGVPPAVASTGAGAIGQSPKAASVAQGSAAQTATPNRGAGMQAGIAHSGATPTASSRQGRATPRDDPTTPRDLGHFRHQPDEQGTSVQPGDGAGDGDVGREAGRQQAGLGLESGLPAAQVAAITQDPLFMNALQEIAELIDWYTLPDEMLSRAAGLQYLAHVPHVLMNAVHTCLASTHTSPLAMAAVRALHWVSQKPATSTHADGQPLAEQLAVQIMGCISGRLQSSLSPLLQTSCLGTAEPGCGSTTARETVLPGVLPLSVAMTQAGIVQVSRDMAVVPVEYLREALLECLVALLRNLTTDVTAQLRFKGGCWQPRVALDCVFHVLYTAASLQRLLGIELQEQLMHVLYYSGSTDSEAGLTGDEAVPGSGGGVREDPRVSRQSDVHKAANTCLHAMLDWYTMHVLQDVNQQGCVYSPTLCCFLLSSPASSPLGMSRNVPASRSNMSGGGAGSAAGSMLQDRRGRGQSAKGVQADSRLKRDSALTKPGPLSNRSGSASGAAQPGSNSQEVLVCMHDLVHLLELFGPQAATLLTTSCNAQLKECIEKLDQQLAARFEGLARVAVLLGLPTGQLNATQSPPQPDPHVAQALINSMLGSVRGVFCPGAMSQVQDTVASLARCLGFRSMLSQAMLVAAARHAPAWAAGIALLGIPQVSTTALDQAGVPAEPPSEQGTAEPDGAGPATKPTVVNAIHLAAAQRDYVDIWQLPRQHVRAGPPQQQAPTSASSAVLSHPTNNLSRIDPVFVQMLKSQLHNPAKCQYWVLLPVLLSFVSGAHMAASPAAPPDAFQLCGSMTEQHLHIIQAATQGWQASFTQEQSSDPVSWPAGMPTEQMGLEQYLQATSAVHTAKRASTRGPSALSSAQIPDLQVPGAVAADQLRWAAAFAAVRG